MAKKTKAAYEKYLNSIYADSFADVREAIDHFAYMCNDTRGKFTTVSNISFHYHNETLGSLLRHYDSITFNVGYNGWSN